MDFIFFLLMEVDNKKLNAREPEVIVLKKLSFETILEEL